MITRRARLADQSNQKDHAELEVTACGNKPQWWTECNLTARGHIAADPCEAAPSDGE